MCMAVFIWQAHPLYPLLLLQNRDEYPSRPTEAAAWWDGGEMLGGKDVVAGRTWLACSRVGKVALLTNVLELHNLPEAKSRGELPVLLLESTKSPLEFAETLVKEAHQYNGFNLISADISSKTLVYISNRPKGEPIVIEEVSPGLHVLSNATLDSPWPKAQRWKVKLKELLDKYGEEEIPAKDMIEKLMRDIVKAEKSSSPGICSLDWEYNLSSTYVEVDTPLRCYGTRSTTVLTVTANGEVNFYETYLENHIWKEQTVSYRISKAKLYRERPSITRA